MLPGQPTMGAKGFFITRALDVATGSLQAPRTGDPKAQRLLPTRLTLTSDASATGVEMFVAAATGRPIAGLSQPSAIYPNPLDPAAFLEG